MTKATPTLKPGETLVREYSGSVEMRRQPSIPFALRLSGLERVGELDAAGLAEWQRDIAATLFMQIEPKIRRMGRTRELERDSDGRIVRLIEVAPDPPSQTMASRTALAAARALVARIVGGE